jgi:hypothetical protein
LPRGCARAWSRWTPRPSSATQKRSS